MPRYCFRRGLAASISARVDIINVIRELGGMVAVDGELDLDCWNWIAYR